MLAQTIFYLPWKKKLKIHVVCLGLMMNGPWLLLSGGKKPHHKWTKYHCINSCLKHSQQKVWIFFLINKRCASFPPTLHVVTSAEVRPLWCETKMFEGRPVLGKSSPSTYWGSRSWQGTLVSVCSTSYLSVDVRKEGKLGFFSRLFVGLFFSLPSELSPCLVHLWRIVELHLPLFALYPTH